MTQPAYRLTAPIGATGTLGLIVLQADETIEQDFRRLIPAPDPALHISRIPSGTDLNPDTIAAMEHDLPQAAALFPDGADFDVVGYACTSGTMLIGATRVSDLVQGVCRARTVTDPLTAARAALKALGVGKIALVSPYIEPVARPMREAFETSGHPVTATVSFGEEVESRVARIDPASIHAAALDASAAPGTEAVFLSCTNLRTLDIIDDLEAALGLPVISSNQALAWAMMRAIGLTSPQAAPGRLFQGRA